MEHDIDIEPDIIINLEFDAMEKMLDTSKLNDDQKHIVRSNIYFG